jgi:hypothetical protein
MPKLLFTPLNAKIMAARSVEVRRANAEAEKLARAQSAYSSVHADTSANGESSFQQARLMRVREELECIDAMMMKEIKKPNSDSKRLKELADAAHRLAEQERVLDNRPLPGSRRVPVERAYRNYFPLPAPVPCEEIPNQ